MLLASCSNVALHKCSRYPVCGCVLVDHGQDSAGTCVLPFSGRAALHRCKVAGIPCWQGAAAHGTSLVSCMRKRNSVAEKAC